MIQTNWVLLPLSVIVCWGALFYASRLYSKIQDNQSDEQKHATSQIEGALATVVAPILAALAALLLGAMLQIQEKGTSADELPAIDTSATNGLLCVLGVLALSGAAVSVDAFLDHHKEVNLRLRDRIFLADGGYLLFCLVISGLNATTLIFYSMGEKGFETLGQVPANQLLLFGLSSFALLAKMLSKEDYQFWLGALIAFHGYTLYTLWRW